MTAREPSRLWRISNYADLSGTGGLMAPGRWHSRGRRIVYTSATPAGAMLEHLVHLDFDFLPASYRLLRIELDGAASIDTLDPATLAGDWTSDRAATRRIGDAWLDRGASLALVVPGSIMPDTTNILLNPAHPDIGLARILGVSDVPYDRRLVDKR